MPRFPVYEIERARDGDLPGYRTQAFERQDLGWSLVGYLITPDGATLVANRRTNRQILSLPHVDPGADPRDSRQVLLWAGEAVGAAKAGQMGLRWELLAADEIPDPEPATEPAASL